MGERAAVLRRLTAEYLRHLYRPFWLAGWLPGDVLWAIDHEPGGREHGYSAEVRSSAGWVRSRLAEWLGPDGAPIPSRSQRMAEDPAKGPRRAGRAPGPRRYRPGTGCRLPRGRAESAGDAHPRTPGGVAQAPPADLASASTSARWRSMTLTTAPMMRFFGRRVAKWTSSTRAASRSAEVFGMYQLRIVMSFVAGAGARTGTRGGVSRTGLSGLAPLSPLSGLAGRGGGAGSAEPTRELRLLRSPAITPSRAR